MKTKLKLALTVSSLSLVATYVLWAPLFWKWFWWNHEFLNNAGDVISNKL